MGLKYKLVFAIAAFLPLPAMTQESLPFPVDTTPSCVTLPDHAAIRECQNRRKAEMRELNDLIKQRYPRTPERLNGAENKLPLNCFRREATGEQVCAN